MLTLEVLNGFELLVAKLIILNLREEPLPENFRVQ
jgi:hypothetical protein